MRLRTPFYAPNGASFETNGPVQKKQQATKNIFPPKFFLGECRGPFAPAENYLPYPFLGHRPFVSATITHRHREGASGPRTLDIRRNADAGQEQWGGCSSAHHHVRNRNAGSPDATVPHFVPYLDQIPSQSVVVATRRESPLLAWKTNAIANRRTPCVIAR
jgi:hypothetical protein